MRMAGPDIVLFVVGALLFGGASYALVQQGGLAALTEQGSTAGLFNVAFETRRVDVGSPVDVASFRSAAETFEVNATNVANVIFKIDCSDGQAGAVAGFTLTVTIEGPNNVSESKSHACATGLEIPVKIASVPASTTAPGSTETEAREALDESPNATKAQGTWTISIQGGRSPGGIPLGQDPAPAPSGAVSVAIEQWEPRFSAVQAK